MTYFEVRHQWNADADDAKFRKASRDYKNKLKTQTKENTINYRLFRWLIGSFLHVQRRPYSTVVEAAARDYRTQSIRLSDGKARYNGWVIGQDTRNSVKDVMTWQQQYHSDSFSTKYVRKCGHRANSLPCPDHAQTIFIHVVTITACGCVWVVVAFIVKSDVMFQTLGSFSNEERIKDIVPYSD